MEISLTPLLNPVIEVLAVVLLGAGTWAVSMLAQRIGLERDGGLASFVDEAIEEGVALAKRRARAAAEDADVEIDNEYLAEAVEHVIESAPKAVRKLGLGTHQIERRIEARLAGELGRRLR